MIMDIVILLSLGIFPHLHIRHTKFIGYSDNLAVNSCPQRYHYSHFILYIHTCCSVYAFLVNINMHDTKNAYTLQHIYYVIQ